MPLPPDARPLDALPPSAPGYRPDGRRRYRPPRPAVLPPAEVEQLVVDNLGLAANLAGIYYRRGRCKMGTIPYDDLRSEAFVALVNAARAFDPARGWKFTTLAWVSIERRLRQVVEADYRFTARTVQPSGAEENALAMIPDVSGPESGPECGAGVLAGVLGGIPPHLRRVLILRFGLDGGGPRTLDAVGGILGVCRERVRQIERAGLQAMRKRIGETAMAKMGRATRGVRPPSV